MKKLLVLLLLGSFAFANGYSSTDYVMVEHSEPVYEYRPSHNPPPARYYEQKTSDSNTIGLDTIIGATAGVVIGNQIGKGNGKDVARVAGGLVGAAVANGTRDQRNGSYDSYEARQYDGYDRSGDRVLVGYRNYFYYEGQEHFKFSKYPLREVLVTRTINY